jgi:fructose-bisphosphate aldolase class II
MPQTWGVPVEEIQRGIKFGVRKVNIDTDCRLAIAGQFRRIAAENKAEFDPRKFLKPSLDAMQALCKNRFELFGAAGQASRITPLPLAAMAERYRNGVLDPQVAATTKAA